MHNDIMAAGSKEHPPMLDSGYTKKETYVNTGLENNKLIDAEAEAVHIILNEIGNDIYSTMDACLNAKEIIARNANPLELVAATQNYLDDYYKAPPAPKPYEPHTPSLIQTTSTRSKATTKNKGKEIAKQPSP
ncbi:hypothetical protein Tco_0766304 [Tanacetum coccineum]